MIINNNISAMFANRMLSMQSQRVEGSIEKLSSGMRINKAADDASLFISQGHAVGLNGYGFSPLCGQLKVLIRPGFSICHGLLQQCHTFT